LWETLTGFAERFDLSAIQLNILLPARGEEYHANWNRKELPVETQLWHSDIPLIAEDVTVGRLRITGRCCNGSVCIWMGDLIAGLKPFETHMLELISAMDVPEAQVDSLRTLAALPEPIPVEASNQSQ
jgi:UDP-GlcNAc:undecaprenyl-phosphate GlcNAc-1-phosphate transferase